MGSDEVPGLPFAWGVTAQEWMREEPCDPHAGPGWTRLMRGVDCTAPPERVWPWLCMLRVAPYSYDLVDNLGRRSPQTLDPAQLDLEVGQRIASIFTVVSFVTGESVTMQVGRGPSRVVGRLLMSYAVRPAPGGSRLIGVLQVPPPSSLLGRVAATPLWWGDLVMMRRQLLNLAGLAERDAAAGR